MSLLHSIKTNGFGHLCEDLTGCYTEWNEAIRSWRRALCRLFNARAISRARCSAIEHILSDTSVIGHFTAPSLLHYDICGEHVLTQNGTVSGILDWGDAFSGDPLCDLARAWQLMTSEFGVQSAHYLLDGYGGVDVERFQWYALFHHCCAMESHYKHQRHQKLKAASLLFAHWKV